jgi:parvulin-like peptidyl-prolyl isomerase
MNRRRILGVLLVAGAGVLAASGCASTLNDAATIHYRDSTGEHTARVSRATLQDQVSALVGNKQLRTALQRNFSVGESDTNTDSKLTAVWLTQLIRDQAVEAQFNAQRLSLTADDISEATSTVQQNYTPAVFNKLPKRLRNDLVMSQARIDVLLKSCASGRTVSHVLVKTKAEAEAALAQLKAGVPFAQVAEQKSIDPGSKNSGGLLGCLAPDLFPAAFQQAAEKADLGVVTGPVRTQFGYHLILAGRWDPQLASNPQVAQLLQEAAGAELSARLAGLDVHVDPRYGTWGSQPSQNGGQTWAVAAPQPPDVPDKRA